MPADRIVKVISTPEEGYAMLAMAVIEEVCRDYREALIMRDSGMIQSCERFLRGPRFAVYCMGNLDPEYLIEKIRGEIYGS